MNIYFDETNHSRVIGQARKNPEKITFDVDRESEYIYGFLSFDDEEIFNKEYLLLENQFRDSTAFPENRELKSKTIFKGQSFKKMTEPKVKFIESLFSLMKKHVSFCQIVSQMKLEVYLNHFTQRAFHHGITNWENGLPKMKYGAFSFSLIKFSNTLNQNKLYKNISGDKSFASCAKFFMKELETHIHASNIDTYEHSNKRTTFRNMVTILRKAIINARDARIVFQKNWDYGLIPKSLRVAKNKDELLIKIDREENVEKAFENAGYSYESVISKDSAPSRAVDIFIGFFRMIVLDFNIVTYDKRQDVNYVTEYNEWYFNIDKRRLQILKNFSRVMGTKEFSFTSFTCSDFSMLVMPIFNLARDSYPITKYSVAEQYNYFVNFLVSNMELGDVIDDGN